MALGTRSKALGSTPKKAKEPKPKVPKEPKAPKPKKVKEPKAPKPKKVKEPKAPKPKKPKAPKRPKASRAPSARRRGRRAGGSGRGGKSVLHSCGHRQNRRPQPGPKWKQEREMEHWAKQPCTTCWQAKQCEDHEIIFDAEGLPPLTGTIAQVNWARSIRAKTVGKVRHEAALLDQACKEAGILPVSEAYLAVAMPGILAMTSSKFWIENRESEALVELALSFEQIDQLYEIDQKVKEAVANPVFCPF